MVRSLRMAATMAAFGGGSAAAEAVVGGLDGGVVPDGGEGGHVQDVAHAGSAAGDGAVSSAGAAVAVDGGDAVAVDGGEGGDAAAGDAAEFGQFGDQGAGGDGSDAGDGREQVLGGAPSRGAADLAADLLVEFGERRLQRGERPLDAAQDLGRAGLAAPVGFHADHLDHLAAAGDEFGEAPGLLGGDRPGAWGGSPRRRGR